jgi:hypothetical protein
MEPFHPRLSNPPSGVDCFLANTVFKTPHGLKSVQELRLGDGVILTDGSTANVVHATEHERASCRLVELVTNQARLKVSENHRIMVIQGADGQTVAREARELTMNDRIMVGTRPAQLAAIRHSIETVSLFNIQLSPDGAVEAYVLPNYGIHVRAVEPNLLAQFQQVPEEELMAAMASQYHD